LNSSYSQRPQNEIKTNSSVPFGIVIASVRSDPLGYFSIIRLLLRGRGGAQSHSRS